MKKECRRNQELERIEEKKKQSRVEGQKKTRQERKTIQTTRKRTCTEIQELEKQAGCDCHANQEQSFFSFL